MAKFKKSGVKDVPLFVANGKVADFLACMSLVTGLWLGGCGGPPIGQGPIQFSPEMQARYDQYLNSTMPGAFAVSDDGVVAYTYCASTACRGGTVSGALATCRQRSRGNCYIYDIGGRVVWRGQRTSPPAVDGIGSRLRSEYGRNELKVDCWEGVKRTITQDRRATLATMMRVRESRVPWTFCDRLVTALAHGELTNQEFIDVQRGSSSEATINRLIGVLATDRP